MFKIDKFLNRNTITLWLLLLGYGWILATDYIALDLLDDFSFANLQLFKGFLFVTVASAGLYLLLYLKDKKLEHSREYANAILETTDVGIAVINEEGYFREVNQAFLRKFKFRRSRIVGRHFTSIIHNGGDVETQFHQLMRGEKIGTNEWTTTDRAGKEMQMVVNASVLQSDTEKLLIVSFTDISEQKSIQQKLENSLLEKEVLIGEIHHRVKNNLALISGITQLQAFNEKSEDIQQKLLANVGRIQTIAALHEMLYQAESFSRLKLDELIRSLVTNVREEKRLEDQTISLDLERVIINVNQAIPCAIIINEVITHIVEDASAEETIGDLSVQLGQENKKVMLRILEKGRERPGELFDGEASSLGALLVETLVSQLEGEHECRSEDEERVFRLAFTKAEVKGVAGSNIL